MDPSAPAESGRIEGAELVMSKCTYTAQSPHEGSIEINHQAFSSETSLRLNSVTDIDVSALHCELR